jgi:hypothetical protein
MCHELACFLYKHSDEYHILLMSPCWHSLQHTKTCTVSSVGGKEVVALGDKAQCHPHSSWQASDNSRFIVLTSIVKKWHAKILMRCAISCLACKQEIAFCCIAPKLLMSCMYVYMSV